MAETTARELKLIQYLNEAYGKERQLEPVLTLQITLAKSLDRKTIADRLQEHLKETRGQAKALERRIKQLGGKAQTGPDLPGPDLASNAVGALTAVANQAMAAAKGPVQALRGTSPNDNLLRNLRDSYWNEAEEIAHYQVIEAVAEQLGDKDTVKLAKEHRRQEERMQAFIEKQIPVIVKEVIKAEVPKEDRPQTTTRRRSSSSSSSSRSRSKTAASRSTSSSRSSNSRSRSSSGSGSRSRAKSKS
jgi:ferritin-like metal-binding protein YciE